MITPVTVTIRGAEGTEEKSYAGKHIIKDGIHRLFYDGENGACRITVRPDRAEIRRDGEALRDLLIVKGEFTDAVLVRDFGRLSFRVKGREILAKADDSGFLFEFSYTLFQGARAVSENTVRIIVRPEN